ncbi:MAG: SPFH domain-containing protein [Candidatus Magasanikbacteria bacterium]
MKSFSIRAAIALMAAITLSTLAGCEGCTGRVPGGYVGMVMTPSGFNGDILAPGNHSCYGKDRMYLLEVSDTQKAVEINQLTTDKINFKASIGVLFSVDRGNKQAIKDAFDNLTAVQTADAKVFVISAEYLFKTYVMAIADEQGRKVYSRYESSEVVSNRSKIVEEVRTGVVTAFQNGLVKIKQVTVNNDDFPHDVNMSWEARARKIIDTETEKAEQTRQLIIKNNELALETLNYQIDLVKAANVADSNKIIGSSITPEYLAYQQIKVMGDAAKGPNNWGFIPFTDYANGKVNGGPADRLTSKGLVDAELIKRIQDARQKGADAKAQQDKAKAPTAPPPADPPAAAPATP